MNTNTSNNNETYNLPENATIGGEWQLPEHFIDTYDGIDAPYWDIEEPEFTGYIKSVKKTDNPNILKVEYYIYRLDKARCAGYYGLWDTGKALVDVKFHKRWNVA